MSVKTIRRAYGRKNFKTVEEIIEYLTSVFIEGLLLIENYNEKKEKQSMRRLAQLLLEIRNNTPEIKTAFYRQIKLN